MPPRRGAVCLFGEHKHKGLRSDGRSVGSRSARSSWWSVAQRSVEESLNSFQSLEKIKGGPTLLLKDKSKDEEEEEEKSLWKANKMDGLKSCSCSSGSGECRASSGSSYSIGLKKPKKKHDERKFPVILESLSYVCVVGLFNPWGKKKLKQHPP